MTPRRAPHRSSTPLGFAKLLVAVTSTLAGFGAAIAEDSWYPFVPRHDLGSGEIGMADWLERPAGKHGRITRSGSELLYDGKPILLWGVNNSFANCAPPRELADRRAAFYAKYGINSVRLHKFGDGMKWAGILAPGSSTEFDPDGLDRMDYFVAKLKEHGIFVKLSAHFGTVKLGPDDLAVVPYAREFGEFPENGKHLAAPHSAFFYSPELQQVHARQMVNLLRHRNPYTGLTYAEDPAVAFVEIINEQSILFHTSMNPLKASPTLRRDVARRFGDWLRSRYQNHQGLLAAWGESAIDSFASEGLAAGPEHLDRDNLLPLGNPWYWDPDQLEGSQRFRRQRLLDSLSFLTELQQQAYRGYIDEIRRAGFGGEIIASNWQAGRAFSHYLNLYTDYQVGLIDRHNYFGGGKDGTFNNASMLSVPGSGSLGSGLQQVADRPFMLSEWIHVFPNEWGVEGPAIIGAYGMGLQGWDVSYLFQNGDEGRFSERLGDHSWDATAPQILGIFPAVSRQVLRGDVATATTSAVRHVHPDSLMNGRLGFEDRVTQTYDEKGFDSDATPVQTLAVRRCEVEFGESYKTTPAVDLSAAVTQGRYRSDTGELVWQAGRTPQDGHFTIDTDATQAVVGFAAETEHALGMATIAPASRFAAIYLTAQDRSRSLRDDRKILLVAIARARNTGMTFNAEGNRLTERGTGSILLEPVRASIDLHRPGNPTVELLDHDGYRTGRTLPVSDGKFTIDGERDRTPYYLISY